MVAGLEVVTLGVACLASAFMAWSIGAGSSGSTPFAPAVGANAITVLRAGLVVGILGLAGAVLQGANVTEAVGRELLVGDPLTPLAAITALTIAAALVAIGVFIGYPIATAFTVTGAVVGVGLALGRGPAWPKYQQIATLWVLVPFVGGGAAYALGRALLSERSGNDLVVPALGGLIGAIVANVGFVVLGPPGESASIASTVGAAVPGYETAGAVATTLVVALAIGGLVASRIRVDETAANREFLLAIGGLVAFSAGGTQVGLAIGPLLPLVDPFAVSATAVLVFGGLGLLAGSWTGAPRMIKALSQDYSSLDPKLSIAALIPSFAIAQTAVFFGIPVSFNEIIVSAIVGSGLAQESGAVSREKAVKTVAAWIVSLALALGVGYFGFAAVRWIAI